MKDLITVTGAGGFIGGHLVRNLLDQGHKIRAVDIKLFKDWWQKHDDVENMVLDLSLIENCKKAVSGSKWVYQLSCNMGGMGFIENNRALCMLSVLINAHMLIAARDCDVERIFYTSSACIYPAYRQDNPEVIALKESDAYPALPEAGYGWEKLFSEHLYKHFMEDFGIEARIARLHNVYGIHSSWKDGREKAPSAICRKIAEAKLFDNNAIEVWGNGRQTRSFQYIDDCIKGINLIMNSDVREPINLGSSELVSINQLVDIVAEIAGVKIWKVYKPDAPKGVQGRNSDNTKIKELFGWEPDTPLRVGLEKTYAWVYDQVKKQYGR